jgi:hypothetical protein
MRIKPDVRERVSFMNFTHSPTRTTSSQLPMMGFEALNPS